MIDIIFSKTNYDVDTLNPLQFSLIVDIIDTCNYSCYYCYNNKIRHNNYIDLDCLYNFILYLRFKYQNLLISITILGGEPTLHPHLDDFIIKCNNNTNIKCILFSNFSQDIQKYIFYLKHGVQLNLSFHLFDDNRDTAYIEKLSHIPAEYFLNAVNIILLYDIKYWKKSLYIFNQLFITYPYAVSMPFLMDNQNFIANYTNDMYTEYDNLIYLNDKYKTIRQKYQLIIHNSFKKDYIMHEMYSDKRYIQYRNFYRYLCDAGKYSLYIHNTGYIYPCESYYDINKWIGSIYNNFTNIKLHQTLCECDMCGCVENAKKIKIFNKK